MTVATATRKALLAALILAALAFPGSVFSHSTTNAAAYSPINLVFDHPEFGAVTKEVQCTITMYGGPAADLGGTYNWTAEITASLNSTGAAIIPSVGAAVAGGVWVVNVTMPDTGNQTVTVKIIGTSTASTGTASVTASSEFEMQVVVPILIRATIQNTGKVDANNVTAKIFADGVLLDTQTVNVSAGASTTISYNWTFLSIRNGRHTVTVTVDDPSNVVEFSNGNNVFTQVIYIGKQGNPAAVGLTFGVIIAAILVGLMFLQKPVRRPLKKP